MLLLDTHALIWLVEGHPSLGRRARSLLRSGLGGDEIGVAAITYWEVAMLADRGRLVLDVPVADWRHRVIGLGIHELPVTGDVAITAASLPGFHPDPADRLIVAAALAGAATLLTADDRILRWPGALVRHDARR
jgi:PIN domain nuclease of toxin-antitoxin system